MCLSDAENLVCLVTAKAFNECELERIEPELGRIISPLHMNVWRLKSVGHVKEKAVSALTENCGHVPMVALCCLARQDV